MIARRDVMTPVVLGMTMALLAVVLASDAPGTAGGPGVGAVAVAGPAAPAAAADPQALSAMLAPPDPPTSTPAGQDPEAHAPGAQDVDGHDPGGQEDRNEGAADGSSPFAASADSARAVVRQQGTPDRYVRPRDGTYRSFTLAATGDLLIHTPVWTRAATPDGTYDFAPQLAAAYDDIAAADIGLCHLEVPLDPDGPYSSYPIFNAPAELADAIADTGWDVCSTASNHSADQGFDGVVRTLDAMDAAGVEHRGMFRSEAEYLEVRLHRVQRTKVGLLSATYGLNGLPMPGGHPWSVQLIEVPVLLDRARRLREAGAEVVVISLHWGTEYQHSPSAYQRDIAAQLMAGPEVDAIIGHHAHVVQPVEWVSGRPVVYGLGNFLSGQRPTERRDGAIVTLEFREQAFGWSVEAVHAQPTWVDDSYSVVIAEPDAGGVLGASAQRTLGYLGVPLSPPPGPPHLPPDHYDR